MPEPPKDLMPYLKEWTLRDNPEAKANNADLLVGLIHANAQLGAALVDEKVRVRELEEEARRWYHADGTFELLDSAEEVVRRRIAAAVAQARLEKAEWERDALLDSLLLDAEQFDENWEEGAHPWMALDYDAGEFPVKRFMTKDQARDYVLRTALAMADRIRAEQEASSGEV